MDIRENQEIQASIAWVRAENARMSGEGKHRFVYVQTFGCQQNEADSEKLIGLSEEMGYTPTSDPKEADLILINTCAVREHAELRALSAIGNCKRLRESNPDLIVGVCGCMTARGERVEKLKKGYPYVSFTLEPPTLHRMPVQLAAVMRERRRRVALSEDNGEIAEGLPIFRTRRHRAYVSIMYGCNNFCTYCIVPYTRGRERSRESDAVADEVRDLVAHGCRDITLLGQNVNSYKSDTDFAGLLARLCEIEGDFILRFMTSHPKDVSDRLIEVIGKNVGKIEPHFHLPLQSGSDRILSEMNRHYTAGHYLGIVDKLRAAVPDISLTSDIIVGFPGETDEDFENTLKILRQVRFDMVYSFIYSPRTGTPAAEKEKIDAVPEEIKGERMRRLLALADEIAFAANERLVGKQLRVLCDAVSRTKGDMYSGRTDAGKLVHFAATPEHVGKFVYVKIDRADPYALHGSITE
ncbi:MAG: tRNA (N6-isopentenyl adenosine(37)-C2)-methylthiotransferase MiaB [Clostridia bacterium]|nr:tRNA (N6-isopentenyl adenosine(37)-C2)-methylthiotransferase MiaB [Clostridia bacterium]